MTLSSWTSLVPFVLFVAPGLLFDLLSRGRRVEVDESAFREASRVALASVALGVPGAIAAYLVWRATNGSSPDLGKLVSGDNEYFREQAGALFWAVVGYAVGSAVVAWAVNYVLELAKGKSLTPSHSQWTQVFRLERPTGSRAYVRVNTKSGLWWGGLVIHYTADLEVAGREITLAPPISRGSEGGTVWSRDAELQRLIIRGDELESMSVMYVASDETVPSQRSRQWRFWRPRTAARDQPSDGLPVQNAGSRDRD
ncbi:hypothetical protein ACVWYS_001401 [Arthrobacter sp. TE12231]